MSNLSPIPCEIPNRGGCLVFHGSHASYLRVPRRMSGLFKQIDLLNRHTLLINECLSLGWPLCWSNLYYIIQPYDPIFLSGYQQHSNAVLNRSNTPLPLAFCKISDFCWILYIRVIIVQILCTFYINQPGNTEIQQKSGILLVTDHEQLHNACSYMACSIYVSAS